MATGFTASKRSGSFKVEATDLTYELEDAGQAAPSSRGVVLTAVAIACVAAFLFGYHLGVVNGSLPYIMSDLGFGDDAALAAWVVSVTLAGACFGSFTGGILADKLGRARTFQLNAVPLIVGTLLSGFATSVDAMVWGRALVGVGIGLSSAVVPLYISEVAPTDIRGLLGAVNQLAINVGILGALIAGLPLSTNPGWWRTMFKLAVIPALALALGMGWAPESPRWLYKQARLAEAEAATRRLLGDEARTREAMADLVDSGGGGSGSETEAGWGDLLSPKYRKVVLIGSFVFLFQQFAGINAIIYYSSAVFRKAGIASDVAASALVGLANVLGTGVASGLMDKQGRKKLLFGSFLGMGLSMALLSISMTWSALAAYTGVLAVVGTVAYILSFSLGVGPVPALLLPEIFPSRIRAKGISTSLGVHWVANFMIGLYFLPVVNRLGVPSVYLMFSAVCFLAVLFVNSYIVETKGRSLEEIERIMTRAT